MTAIKIAGKNIGVFKFAWSYQQARSSLLIVNSQVAVPLFASIFYKRWMDFQHRHEAGKVITVPILLNVVRNNNGLTPSRCSGCIIETCCPGPIDFHTAPVPDSDNRRGEIHIIEPYGFVVFALDSAVLEDERAACVRLTTLVHNQLDKLEYARPS